MILSDDQIRRLRDGDENAWFAFTQYALKVILKCLRGSVSEADVDDVRMRTLKRVHSDFKKWDPARGLSISSFIWLKAEDEKKRYCKQMLTNPAPESLEEISDDGAKIACDDGDPGGALERSERVQALGSAISKLEVHEQLFACRYAEGDSLALAAATAGYPVNDQPENIIRRIRRKLMGLLEHESYFIENPGLLQGLKSSGNERERNGRQPR